MSFTEKLDPESLAAFNIASKKSFSEQAQFFLNAFWDEFGSEAECIYSVSWDTIKKADMRVKGISYIHLYDEGDELDFDMSLYFFELLCKFFNDDKNANWRTTYPKSVPTDMTSIKRKQELRERVDVNFDGKMSLLEYLLYQYDASPKMLMDRSRAGGELPAEVLAAMRALEEVNKRVRAYEAEKQRLIQESESGTGIKALKAKNELAQLNSSPLWEELNKALISAEAAVRIAKRKYGVTGSVTTGDGTGPRTNGTMWWLERELQEKQRLYGGKK
eukprot:CAMPEP_0177648630 /NCGR_PEP_ID=MMETSP0447-20121125/10928_1 /TAXON_ID=0 /ORGANISM="Stygamoeba regulata, Strain BSH-02190019" /LENGTH=274 /DNA_ID=CAMNT_0019151279 /DNA_START=45 /DNA_END=869 /DNA_ORIENTATION=+